MTPLYNAIRAYAAQKPARFHMPGHKGSFLPVPELQSIAPLDVTEVEPTGDLFSGGEPFDTAQKLWAERFGMDNCLFLTGGSTLGLHAALALFCRPGDQVLIDRGCHRAVYNALALLDLEPVYLPRPWKAGEGIAGPISPTDVENLLDSHPNIKTICIASPTYSGVLSDIKELSHIIHARGGNLIVDGAHGAHLPFLGVDAFSGCDALICSAHKTLPALGQSALLFTNGVDPRRVRQMTSVFGSSSPSYPMMISLDCARDYLDGKGMEEYRRVARRTAALRAAFPSLQEGELRLDPTRLTLTSPDGNALAQALEGENIWPEMADSGHVVLILTAQDSEDDLHRLEEALQRHRTCWAHRHPAPAADAQACSFPAGSPVRPGGASPSGELPGPGCGRPAGSLSPRRAGGGSRRGDWGKRTGLFAGNRI